jgi:hypothetical protein
VKQPCTLGQILGNVGKHLEKFPFPRDQSHPAVAPGRNSFPNRLNYLMR